MTAARVTVRNRRIELDAPEEMPDGTELLIEMSLADEDKIGIDESEWKDDPESIREWVEWVKSIEPLEFTPEEQAEADRSNEEFRRFNLEAVRKQMESENPWP
jgi:hypothetical protein